jgi:DNA-binding CsgD family transcriptional regulator
MNRRLKAHHLEVLGHLIAGRHRLEIAPLMYASPHTVKAWTAQLYDRVGARTGPQAVHLAYQTGLLVAPVTPTPEQHVVTVHAAGWAVAHPDRCRSVWSCPASAARLDEPPAPGRYTCHEADGRLIVDAPAREVT